MSGSQPLIPSESKEQEIESLGFVQSRKPASHLPPSKPEKGCCSTFWSLLCCQSQSDDDSLKLENV